MSEQKLHGAALYNPHLHGKEELIDLFAARQKLLDLLLEALRSTSGNRAPQHHLVIGQRGMGKTMLLHRLGYAIEDDSELSKILLPLTFPEEQYNVARLSDFWLNCTDALSDLFERTGRSRDATELDEQAKALRSMAEERRAKQALALLTRTAKSLGRRLVLLVDNVDLIFDRIGDQDWLLREALSTNPSLALIGASASAVESTYDYGQAFYDFFRVHELEGLDLEETRQLIVHYAESWKYPEVKRLAGEDPVRIRVLHNLTGGNPRTIALLFNVLAMGVEGDVRTDLERLLDQCTPLYKARFEALSPQAQQLVHAVAVHWDPTSAGELAEALAMDVNAVSSQLARLAKQGIVEKVPYDPESKTGFQIAERFFNIWYLMRASRRVRRRLLWLVEFLRSFYSQDQLRERALAHIESVISLDPSQRLRYAEYSFALAEAVSDRAWSLPLESSGLYALLGDAALREQIPELFDLEGEPRLKERAELEQRLEKARPSVIAAQIALDGWSGLDFWSRLKASLITTLEFKVRIAEHFTRLAPGVSIDDERVVLAIAGLKSALDSEPGTLEGTRLDSRTVESMRKAIEMGLMAAGTDIAGAAEVEKIWNTSGIQALALSFLISSEHDPRLLSKLEKALETAADWYPWYVWLSESIKHDRVPSAPRLKKLVKRVLALAKDQEGPISAIGKLLIDNNLFGQAEHLLHPFLASNPQSAMAWFQMGNLKAKLGNFGGAAEALRKGLENDRQTTDPRWAEWASLGVCLICAGSGAEAETACRQAIALGPSLSLPLRSLGLVLDLLGRPDEAENAYGHALAIDPKDDQVKSELARLLLKRDDFEGAGDLVRDLSEMSGGADIRAALLAHREEWSDAAENARKAIASELIKNREGSWSRMLAFFHEAVRTGKASEALQILDETGAAERWRPLKEALEAIARGSEAYLRRVAPEVRQPAREIYRQLLEPPRPKTPVSSAKLQGRRSLTQPEGEGPRVGGRSVGKTGRTGIRRGRLRPK